MDKPTQDKYSWLQELSNQSWNLELAVSGAAIFSTSFLPDLIEKAITYYFENFQANDDLPNFVLPTLAYAFAKSSAYLLIITFFVHFVLRAFWIATLGLRAVFPQGIIFENLPYTNNIIRENLKQKFGSLNDFIIRLDRICSQIFSIAFALVLFSIMMASMYMVAFFLIIGVKTYFPNHYVLVQYFFIAVAAVFFSIGILAMIIGSKEKYREHPTLGKILKLYVQYSTLIYFGMYKPINYINFVFASNVSHKKYYLYSSLLGITFMTIAMSIYLQKLSDYRGITLLESRDFYSTGKTDSYLKSNFYDTLRGNEEDISEACIQADVIQEPYIKLFIIPTTKII